MPIGFRPLDLIVVFVIALLIFGPKKLPELSRGIAKSIQQFRKGINELKGPSSHGDDLDEQVAQQALSRARVENARLELEALERDIANKRAAAITYEAEQPRVNIYEAEQPETVTYKAEQPETVTYKAEQSEAVAHETEQPETVTHKTEQSEAVTHKTEQSEAVTHKTEQSEAVTHETEQTASVDH